MLSTYDNFNKDSFIFIREHDKIIKKFNLNFIFLKNAKLPIIYLYKIIDELFKNNSKKIETIDIILLTLTSLAIISKENDEDIIILIDELTNKKMNSYISIVKRSLKTIRMISNMILKQDGVVINNIEQFIKYKFSIKILNLIYSYIFIFNVKIKDFSYWYKSDTINKNFKDMLKYIKINYI